MIKINISIALLLSLVNSASANQFYTPTACPVDCNGSKPVSAFDFWKKAKASGDPNGGKLGSTIQVPSNPDDPSAPADTTASTDDYFNQLNDFEKWSASQCGVSLADDSAPDEILVSQDCNLFSNVTGPVDIHTLFQ